MERRPYWIIVQHLTRANDYVCSECRKTFAKPWYYCPNCGAVPQSINSKPTFPTEESRFTWKRK